MNKGNSIATDARHALPWPVQSARSRSNRPPNWLSIWAKRAPRGHDQDIRTGVVIGVGGKTVLPGVRAEADHRDPTAEGVIDFAGFVPFQGRDDQSGSVEEAPVLELGLQRGPIHDIEVRVSCRPEFLDQRRTAS